MQIDKETVCNMFEVKYIRSKGYDPKDLNDFYHELYPEEWLENDDYDLKIKMLAEAIKDDKVHIYCSYYKE